MAKLGLFFLFLILMITYPLMINTKVKIEYGSSFTLLPKIEFINGKFLIYDDVLSKRGNFKKLTLSSSNIYFGNDVFLEDLLKKEAVNADKVMIKDNIISGKGVKFFSLEYNLSAKYAKYNKYTKIVDGEDFEIIGRDYKGRGKEFMMDREKNIYANHIDFVLKVDK